MKITIRVVYYKSMLYRILFLLAITSCSVDSIEDLALGGNDVSHGGMTSQNVDSSTSSMSYSWSECQIYYVSDSLNQNLEIPVECEEYLLEKGRDPEKPIDFQEVPVEERVFCEVR